MIAAFDPLVIDVGDAGTVIQIAHQRIEFGNSPELPVDVVTTQLTDVLVGIHFSDFDDLVIILFHAIGIDRHRHFPAIEPVMQIMRRIAIA